MNFEVLRQHGFSREIVSTAGRARAKDVVGKILPYLTQTDKILDLGAGTCNVADLLTAHNFRVTTVDVKDSSFVPGIKPIVYDGRRLPFADNVFTVVLLLDVLHHAQQPFSLVREAGRVANRLVVMETTFSNPLQRMITVAMDAVANLEFVGYPRNHRSDGEWRQLFARANLRALHVDHARFWWMFQGETYDLQKIWPTGRSA